MIDSNSDLRTNFTCFCQTSQKVWQKSLEKTIDFFKNERSLFLFEKIKHLALKIFSALRYSPINQLTLIKRCFLKTEKNTSYIPSYSPNKSSQNISPFIPLPFKINPMGTIEIQEPDNEISLLPEQRLEQSGYEDVYFERIKLLTERSDDFLDRSQRYFTSPCNKTLTSCGTTFYAVLFAFSNSFVNQDTVEEINKNLNPSKTIPQLLQSINEGQKKLLQSDGKQGILYAITLSPFIQNEKLYPGHSLLIQQYLTKKDNREVRYRIYQSYVDCFSLQSFMETHPHFLQMNHKAIEEFCQKLSIMLAKDSWDEEFQGCYQNNFCASHVELSNLSLLSQDNFPLLQLHFMPIDYFVDIPKEKTTSLSDEEKINSCFQSEENVYLPCYVRSESGQLIPHPQFPLPKYERPKVPEGVYYEFYKQQYPTYV